MNFLNLFSRPLYIHYYGRLLSEATLFYIIITLIRFLLPLWIVWKSDSFWIKESSYREMPNIDFKKEFILLLNVGEKTEMESSTVEYSTYGHSTIDHIDKAFRQINLWIPVNVAEYELDYNDDAKNEELNINLEIPIDLNPKRMIYGFRLILFFYYRLSDKILLQMESLADIINHSTEPGQMVQIYGDLEFVQKVPFPHRGQEFIYNKSIVIKEPENGQETFTFDDNPFFLDEMLRDYTNRDYYTKIVPSFHLWQPYKTFNSDNNLFQIFLKINYHDHQFQYQTGFWFLIKWALVQYLAVFILLDYFINFLKSYVFDEYIVASQVRISDVELVRSIMDKKHL